MGQKINPLGFRLGISKNWHSKWFTGKSLYAPTVLEDYEIRKFLKSKFDQAGLESVNIERMVNEINITVRVAKPGLVIGKGGAGVENIKEELKKFTKSKTLLSVEDVKVPELEASLVADYICRQLKRRMHYRRVAISAANSAMDRGAKGVKIKLAGLLGGGNSIARSEVVMKGSVPAQTLRADIDYAQLDCHLLYGAVGIKVWIYKGEISF